ncbi:MAG TPA: AAA family ATPase [Verrucomicrobiae bacterium]|nr:AAA family ATPase [Verrucomicrobiae bacterium]
MNNPSIRYVPMPPTVKHPNGHILPLKDRVLVVVGANGSGKTRFGAWLDSRDAKLHHRVGAHRSLVFPERVQPRDYQEAELRLFSGHHSITDFAHHRLHTRWQNKPATALLADFEPLVTLMVSESFTVSDKYRVTMQAENQYVAPPVTRLDVVKKIWETILPSRELIITGTRIEARNRKDSKSYHAKEMSDGERGIFHLIGEALSAPKNGVFIVDEPELHLHRAIQSRLWDAVEVARADCTFVYITHDLGFAASRKDATKVWLREYTNDKWDWEEVPETDAFPESMLLEVMGSRRPVLFVEGERDNLDYFIYGKVFPQYTVVPCGSCEVVIHSTRSFAAMAELHHNTCGGLVDNDGRSEADIQMLNKLGVAVLPVALVENLFLVEPVLRLAATKLGRNPDETAAQVKSRVLESLKRNSVQVISNLTRQEMEMKLRRIGKGEDGAEALATAFTSACAAINPTEIYKRWETEIGRVSTDNDFSAALRYYKIKGLASEAGAVFALKYSDQIMRWLRSENAQEFIEALQTVVPKPAI